MDYQRLGDQVRDRRNAIGLKQHQAAERAGISLPVWGVVERAERTRYRKSTFRAVERALGWASGSVEAILAGGEPTLLETSGAVLQPATSSAQGEVSAPVEARVSALEVEVAAIRRILERYAPPEPEAAEPRPRAD